MTHNYEKEIQQIQNLMKKTKNKRMYERYQIIYFYMQGYHKKLIPQMTSRSHKTVYNYINAFKEKGIDGLTLGKPTGAPRKLSTTQEQELVQVIVNKLPSDIGFPNKNRWTLAIIKSFIENEWDKSYTLRGVSYLLHDLGLSYTKPTYTLAKANPMQQKEFIEETFPTYKKTLK